MTESDPEFLDVPEVLELHAAALARWGGQDGVRDPGTLSSAVLQPQATFDGEYLHGDLFLMAAAYAFHIAEAQAFVDGNKRAGVLAAVIFLDRNGVRVPQQEDVLYLALLEVADRTMSKAQLADLLRELAGI
jgi:death-on-curing protein